MSLPDGFEYWSLGWTGDFLDSASGEPSQPIHDGMGVVDQFGDHVELVRNHEVTDLAKSFASTAKIDSPVGGGARQHSSGIQRRGPWSHTLPASVGPGEIVPVA